MLANDEFEDIGEGFQVRRGPLKPMPDKATVEREMRMLKRIFPDLVSVPKERLLGIVERMLRT